MIILKVTKNHGFTHSPGDTFLKNSQVGGGLRMKISLCIQITRFEPQEAKTLLFFPK